MRRKWAWLAVGAVVGLLHLALSIRMFGQMRPTSTSVMADYILAFPFRTLAVLLERGLENTFFMASFFLNAVLWGAVAGLLFRNLTKRKANRV